MGPDSWSICPLGQLPSCVGAEAVCSAASEQEDWRTHTRALGVDPHRHHPGGVEGIGGQRPQGGPVGLAHRPDRLAPGADVAGEVDPVRLLHAAVRVGEARHLGHRHEEAPALAADLAPDAALLGAPAGTVAEASRP